MRFLPLTQAATKPILGLLQILLHIGVGCLLCLLAVSLTALAVGERRSLRDISQENAGMRKLVQLCTALMLVLVLTVLGLSISISWWYLLVLVPPAVIGLSLRAGTGKEKKVPHASGKDEQIDLVARVKELTRTAERLSPVVAKAKEASTLIQTVEQSPLHSLVFNQHEGTAADVENFYDSLILHGAGQWRGGLYVPVGAVLDPVALDFIYTILNRKNGWDAHNKWLHISSKLIGHFSGDERLETTLFGHVDDLQPHG